MDTSIKFTASAVVNRLSNGTWQPVSQTPATIYITRGDEDEQARLLVQAPTVPQVLPPLSSSYFDITGISFNTLFPIVILILHRIPLLMY